MVALNCPLCCNETFPSHTSLKCHILNILDNLTCPSCHLKFPKLAELAEHLESNCADAPEAAETKTEHEAPQEGSILARALLASPRPEVDGKTEMEESQYYCQMCDVHFDDIETHLKNFHEGQEIILEEEGGSERNEDVTEETVFIIDPPEAESNEADKTAAEKKPNTVTQEDFRDREGRLYTRKFVKIDQFWLQNDPLQKLVVNDAKDELVEINKCPNCSLYFSTADLFKGHACQNSDDFKGLKDKKPLIGPFNCEICNTTFPTFKSLRLHRRMHDPIKAREIEAPSKYGLFGNDVADEPVRHMFICKICNKTYDKQYELVHMNSHSSNNGFNCEVCNRKFFTKTNLEMHMKAHSNNKKFTCSYCKKPFVTYDALNEHLLNQCQKRPYACQFCGRRFARPHEKVKHERIHTGEKPHVCDICGKAFRVSYCLTLHLRTHSGTRPYQCKHCGKRFKSHSVYNHHLLTHSDVRAYKCPYCPKAFKTSVQLAGHKNSHIKPFTCTECNRPFASLYAVRAHMETHKRDNNLKYECWMCGALYSRAFALRDHLKQQHHQDGEKEKAVALNVDEEMEATNSILVSEDDIILGLDGATNIEIIENENE
ncbi:zinc finger protein 2 -like [Asbolus verrucosus]|uniref:Zinc finger protein 2-like n=1 Tax=Asbolus verrucosus TaxID=1661398 RepID=A0A482VWE1_ASBVE|nr:zinc finger protein 2 -like [Asbolus verrucosus]